MEKRVGALGVEVAVGLDDQRVASVRDSWWYRRLVRPIRRRGEPDVIDLSDDAEYDEMLGVMERGQMMWATWVAQAMYATAKLSLVDHLRGQPRSVDELAALTQTHGPSLARLLRALTSIGLVRQIDESRYAVTPAGQLLDPETEGSVRDLAIMYGEPWHWRPWGEIVHTLRTGQPAFDHLYGQEFFDYMADHPEAEATFNNAMNGSLSPLIDELDVTAAYDFAQHELIIDVGGGYGALLTSILRANPGVQGTLFDRPAAAEEAKRRLSNSDVADRCSVAPGDFFVSVPAGGDVYLLKNIIHDWGDKESIQILKSVRAAMGPTAKVLVLELIVPTGGQASFAKLLDLELMVLVSGRERTEAEFSDLFTAAGLRLERTIPLATEEMHLLEAHPA